MEQKEKNILLEKIRKARQVKFDLAEYGYPNKSITIQRPTELEIDDLVADERRKGQPTRSRELISRYVVAWTGFCAVDLYANEDDTPIDYDPEFLIVWLEDKSNLAAKINNEIINSYFNYLKNKEVRSGEQNAG